MAEEETSTPKYIVKKKVAEKELSSLNKGHRQRLKDRFLKHPKSFEDSYELLELLLTYSIPQKDVKPLAKRLLASFGTIDGVLFAPNDLLLEFKDVKENTLVLFKLFRSIYLKILQEKAMRKSHGGDWRSVLDYCSGLARKEVKEHFYLILLNSLNDVLEIIEMERGSVNEVNICIREILEVLIKSHSVSFALFHNHPSGNTQPSARDIATTRDIKQMADQINVQLYDHFIFGPNGEKSSFRQLGYL